ncbi:hypothetical protein RFI_18198, partial [Reticulomyxa filosa]
MNDNLRSQLQNFSSEKLKFRKTRVRQQDGSVFEESVDPSTHEYVSRLKSNEKTSKEEKEVEEEKETKEYEHLFQRPTTEEEISRHDAYVSQFDIEQWYPLLSHVTFQTEFVELSIDEAIQMIELHKGYHNFSEDKHTEQQTWLHQQVEKHFKSLLEKLNNQLERMDSQKTGVFAKVNCHIKKKKKKKKKKK